MIKDFATPLEFHIRPDSHDDCDVNIVREIWTDNVYQVTSVHEFESVIDIGANIGIFTAYAAKLYPNAQIYAYEPEPDNFEYLQRNIDLHECSERVSPFRTAIWTHDEGITIEPLQGDSVTSESSGSMSVPSMTFDHIFEDNNLDECDVMKIDIEGAEYEVIPTVSVEYLSRIKYLTMETHPTSSEKFGALMAHLSMAFNIHFFGSYETGGQFYGRRF